MLVTVDNERKKRRERKQKGKYRSIIQMDWFPKQMSHTEIHRLVNIS